MRIMIPTIGAVLELTEDWTFTLHEEKRNKFNCDGSFVVYFGGPFGKKKEQQILTEREIDAMRVWTHDGFVERTLTIEQRSDLRQSFVCLSGGGK